MIDEKMFSDKMDIPIDEMTADGSWIDVWMSELLPIKISN